jgi:hypothetical protein
LPKQPLYRLIPFTRTTHGSVLSTGTIKRSFPAHGIRGQEVLQVQRACIFGDAFKTSIDLGIGQAMFDPELTFHIFSNSPTGPGELTGRGGLVLAEHSARLGERQFLRIVAGKAEAVACWQGLHGAPQCLLNQCQIAMPIRIDRSTRGRKGVSGFLVRQGFHSTIRSQPIHKPLREHGA